MLERVSNLLSLKHSGPLTFLHSNGPWSSEARHRVEQQRTLGSVNCQQQPLCYITSQLSSSMDTLRATESKTSNSSASPALLIFPESVCISFPRLSTALFPSSRSLISSLRSLCPCRFPAAYRPGPLSRRPLRLILFPEREQNCAIWRCYRAKELSVSGAEARPQLVRLISGE